MANEHNQDAERNQARKKAMDLLLHNDRTEAELRERLLKKEFDVSSVEDAVNYVKSFGYIDDERYAKNYVEFYRHRKSARQLEQDLQRKGVDAMFIESALAESGSDEPALKRALEKKVSSPQKLAEYTYEEKQKVMAYLYRKGFQVEDIRKAMDTFLRQW